MVVERIVADVSSKKMMMANLSSIAQENAKSHPPWTLGIKDFFFFLNTNKRLEQLFGIGRSTRGGNLNFDCLDLRDRLADAVLIQWIYSKHPEWDKTSRRLNNSIDRKNVHSWRGDTKVAHVDLKDCWNKGREWAVAKLSDSWAFSIDELDVNRIVNVESGVDMLRPYRIRKAIGVLAGDRAEYDLVDLDMLVQEEEP